MRPAGAATNPAIAFFIQPFVTPSTVKLLLCIILLTAPAAAQSIDPEAYGRRYCYLRSLGVDQDAARRAAVEYSYLADRSSIFVKTDTAEAARYVVENCPSNRIAY